MEYICVAMMLYVKEYLMNQSDGTYILQRLLKYPPVESIGTILSLANKYRSIIEQHKIEFQAGTKEAIELIKE